MFVKKFQKFRLFLITEELTGKPANLWTLKIINSTSYKCWDSGGH